MPKASTLSPPHIQSGTGAKCQGPTANAVDFEYPEIETVICVYDTLVEVVNEISEGYGLLIQIWEAIFKAPQSSSKTRMFLQRAIIERREKLVRVLCETSRYDLYSRLIKPNLLESDKKLELEIIIDILQPQASETGFISCNKDLVEAYLLNPDASLSIKRNIIKTFVRMKLGERTEVPYKKKTYKSRMRYIQQFLEWTKMAEDENEWYYNQRVGTPYDDVLHIIGYYPGIMPLSYFLEEIIDLVSDQYKFVHSYHFLTAIMRTLVDKNPRLVLNYFRFKENQIRRRSMHKHMVLFPDDLSYAMRACLKFDLELLSTLYKNHEDLRDSFEGQQEAALLEMSRQLKDWPSLQRRFQGLYGKGDFPLSVHYAIAMQGLESLGQDTELVRLYDQAIWRHMKLNRAIVEPILKSRIAMKDQNRVVEIFDDYIARAKVNKADHNGVQELFPLVVQIAINEKNHEMIFELLERYHEKEKGEKFQIVSSATLGSLLQNFSESHSLKNILRLRSFVERSNMESTPYYAALIAAYTKVGLYEEAETLSYEAHSKSHVPFSELHIWAMQFANYRVWLERCTDIYTRRYLISRLEFISRSSFATRRLIFNSEAGVLFHANVIQYLQNAKRGSAIGVVLRASRRVGLRSELFYLPVMRACIIKNPMMVLKLFDFFSRSGIKKTARTYEYLLQVILRFDLSASQGFVNSTNLVDNVLGSYGFGDPRARIDDLDAEKDMLYLARMMVHYLEVVGPEIGAERFKDFVRKLYEKFGDNLNFEMQRVIFDGIRCVTGTTDQALNIEIKKVERMIRKYIDEWPFPDKEVTVPPDLADAYKDLMFFKFQRLKAHKRLEELDDVGVLDFMLLGIMFTNNQNTVVLLHYLKYGGPKKMIQVLNIIEKHLISGNMNCMKFYMDKRLEYKICLKFLSDSYPNRADEIMKEYQILNEYYHTLDLEKVKKQVKSTGIKNFMRNISGKPFRTKTDYFRYKYMFQRDFLYFFNPDRIPEWQPRATDELLDLVRQKIQDYRTSQELSIRSLRKSCPKLTKFLDDPKNRYHRAHLERFRSRVAEYYPKPRRNRGIMFLVKMLIHAEHKFRMTHSTTQENVRVMTPSKRQNIVEVPQVSSEADESYDNSDESESPEQTKSEQKMAMWMNRIFKQADPYASLEEKDLAEDKFFEEWEKLENLTPDFGPEEGSISEEEYLTEDKSIRRNGDREARPRSNNYDTINQSR
ncbi:hypothetical protein Cantr_10694 [Candida viswanathii]|uniref:Uncharacterized protein n=1 Tax=Candida viswanathii TaxID=5486 RepID=A0A367YD47_9ASCO|nr:hypothetical protein Cantr_10694 [Candida viswanathii]